jgi:hypothetical protein
MVPNFLISLVLATQAVSYKRRALYLPLIVCYFHYLEDLSLGHLIQKIYLQDMQSVRARLHLQRAMSAE